MNFGADKKLSHSKDDGPPDPLNLPSQLYEKRFERMQEDLLLKQIKRHLRAQRLIQSASLPPGMEERQHRMNLRKQERKARDKRLNRICKSLRFTCQYVAFHYISNPISYQLHTKERISYNA